MLIVRIYINDQHIGTATARRIKGEARPNSLNTYLVNEGKKTLKHKYGDGAAKLAAKILKYIDLK